MSMSRLVGPDIDKKLHQDLLMNFTNFLKSFSPLIDSTEKYQQMISSLKLLDSSEVTDEKVRIIEELSQTLTSLVPAFVKISLLEDKLEKLLES